MKKWKEAHDRGLGIISKLGKRPSQAGECSEQSVYTHSHHQPHTL